MHDPPKMYLYKVASLSSILSVSLFVLIVKYFWAQNTAEGTKKGGLSHVLCPPLPSLRRD